MQYNILYCDLKVAAVYVYCNTVECRGSKLYCNTVYWVAVYCNTLHCIVAGRAAGGQVVSQYNLKYRGMRQGCLCRKIGSCVATRCWAGALGARGVQADAGGALGAQAAGRGARQGVAGERQARGRGSWGARPRLSARSGRAGWPGLCTWCTRPVFGPVRLGIFPEANFWTLFVNPVHEHCLSQNFPKKKLLN